MRHNTFPGIHGLDAELNLINKRMSEISGKKVDKLPNPKDVSEFSRYFVKQEDGTYKEYVKLDGEFIEK